METCGSRSGAATSDRRRRRARSDGSRPGGTITEFSSGLPTNAFPTVITNGPDGNLWFADSSEGGASHAVGHVTPSGTITELAGTLANNQFPGGIATGPDGNLWLGVDGASSTVLRVTPAGVAHTFTDPSLPHSGTMRAIVRGSDGNLWFTEYDFTTPLVARVTPSGTITTFPLPSGQLPPGHRGRRRRQPVGDERRIDPFDRPDFSSRLPDPVLKRPAGWSEPTQHRARSRWQPVVHRLRLGPRGDREDHARWHDHGVHERARLRQRPTRDQRRTRREHLVHRSGVQRRPGHLCRRASRAPAPARGGERRFDRDFVHGCRAHRLREPTWRSSQPDRRSVSSGTRVAAFPGRVARLATCRRKAGPAQRDPDGPPARTDDHVRDPGDERFRHDDRPHPDAAYRPRRPRSPASRSLIGGGDAGRAARRSRGA